MIKILLVGIHHRYTIRRSPRQSRSREIGHEQIKTLQTNMGPNRITEILKGLRPGIPRRACAPLDGLGIRPTALRRIERRLQQKSCYVVPRKNLLQVCSKP